MGLMRLQKFLSAAGVCSRRRGEAYIQAGRVRVNGTVVRVLGVKVDPEKDSVLLDDSPVSFEAQFIYIALNKPVGYVTSCDQPGERIVVDLIDIPQRVYPVGRLDKDSTGLLLLTNDGRLHHQLSHPSFDHEKEYEVSTIHPMPEGALRKMGEGVPLMGSLTRTAQVRRVSSTRFRIVLKEGRNRQVRRMVRKVGGHVATLKRIRVAGIRLGNLAEGTWRYLTAAEISTLGVRVPSETEAQRRSSTRGS